MPKGLAGTSAGAIIAALVAAGYSAGAYESYRARLSKASRTGASRIASLSRPALYVLRSPTASSGQALSRWSGEDCLVAKGCGITVRPAGQPEAAEDPRYRYRVRIIASDLTSPRAPRRRRTR